MLLKYIVWLNITFSAVCVYYQCNDVMILVRESVCLRVRDLLMEKYIDDLYSNVYAGCVYL